MSRNKEQIIKHLRGLNPQATQTIAAIVNACNETERTINCTADGIEYTDVRLTAINDSNETSCIVPAVDSWVLIAFIENSQTDAVVIAYSQIDKIILKSDKLNTTIDLKTGLLNIANNDISLIDIFSSFITELKNAIITTPSGAGSVSPTTITKLNQVETKFKQLFN